MKSKTQNSKLGPNTFKQMRKYGPNNEINGLTLQGVGYGTLIDYIQVQGNQDDGIEWFGGTANVKHAVLTNNDDDDIDFDEGYQGNTAGFSVSANTKELIEEEVKNFIQQGYDTAFKILTKKKKEWERLATGLLEYETLTGEEIKKGALDVTTCATESMTTNKTFDPNRICHM